MRAESEVSRRVPMGDPDEEGTFGSDGIRLFRHVWRPVNSRRAVLVIVHGLRDHGARYGQLARELTHLGVIVHGFDLRGHGQSDGPRAYTPTFEDYLRDLERFFSFIREKEAMTPTFLMGHSMGGAIAALFAITRSPELKGLVLSAPALQPGHGVSKFLRLTTRALGAVVPWAPLLKLNPEDFSRDPEVVQANKTDPLIRQRSGPARTAWALLDGMGQIQRRMEEVRVPLLLLHGSADKVTSPAGSEELSKRAQSADVTLKTYPGLYHDLIHEPEGAQVRSDIASWVKARLG